MYAPTTPQYRRAFSAFQIDFFFHLNNEQEQYNSAVFVILRWWFWLSSIIRRGWHTILNNIDTLMEKLQGCDFYYSFCFCHLMQEFTLILNIIKAIFEPNLASSDWVFHEQTWWSTSDKQSGIVFMNLTVSASVCVGTELFE